MNLILLHQRDSTVQALYLVESWDLKAITRVSVSEVEARNWANCGSFPHMIMVWFTTNWVNLAPLSKVTSALQLFPSTHICVTYEVGPKALTETLKAGGNWGITGVWAQTAAANRKSSKQLVKLIVVHFSGTVDLVVADLYFPEATKVLWWRVAFWEVEVEVEVVVFVFCCSHSSCKSPSILPQDRNLRAHPASLHFLFNCG